MFLRLARSPGFLLIRQASIRKDRGLSYFLFPFLSYHPNEYRKSASGTNHPTNSVNVNPEEYGRYVVLSIAHSVAIPPNTQIVMSWALEML